MCACSREPKWCSGAHLTLRDRQRGSVWAHNGNLPPMCRGSHQQWVTSRLKAFMVIEPHAMAPIKIPARGGVCEPDTTRPRDRPRPGSADWVVVPSPSCPNDFGPTPTGAPGRQERGYGCALAAMERLRYPPTPRDRRRSGSAVGYGAITKLTVKALGPTPTGAPGRRALGYGPPPPRIRPAAPPNAERSTATGVSRWVDMVPSPSFPNQLLPHAHRRPWSSSARLWLSPALRIRPAAPPNAERSTATGVSRWVVVPSPSCPEILAPHAHRRPWSSSARYGCHPRLRIRLRHPPMRRDRRRPGYTDWSRCRRRAARTNSAPRPQASLRRRAPGYAAAGRYGNDRGTAQRREIDGDRGIPIGVGAVAELSRNSYPTPTGAPGRRAPDYGPNPPPRRRPWHPQRGDIDGDRGPVLVWSPNRGQAAQHYSFCPTPTGGHGRREPDHASCPLQFSTTLASPTRAAPDPSGHSEDRSRTPAGSPHESPDRSGHPARAAAYRQTRPARSRRNREASSLRRESWQPTCGS
jgi:hypothetical protein